MSNNVAMRSFVFCLPVISYQTIKVSCMYHVLNKFAECFVDNSEQLSLGETFIVFIMF